ncbi:MAG: hypothetical protein RMK94_04545 [Armatimonadota bacterium]|nr:hypothetical protein [Armatimonadota bacterium]
MTKETKKDDEVSLPMLQKPKDRLQRSQLLWEPPNQCKDCEAYAFLYPKVHCREEEKETIIRAYHERLSIRAIK